MKVIRWATLALLLVAPGCTLGSHPAAGGVDTSGIVVEDVAVPDEELDRAVGTALADDRLGELLTAEPHRVESVRAPAAGPGIVVIVGFEVALDDAVAWPLDVCAVDTGGQPITGIVWLVEHGSVRAVSPRWGDDLACGY